MKITGYEMSRDFCKHCTPFCESAKVRTAKPRIHPTANLDQYVQSADWLQNLDNITRMLFIISRQTFII
jgi:hypothetical protein